MGKKTWTGRGTLLVFYSGLSILALLLFLAAGCGKSNLSDRDIKRSQLTNSADIKRKELQQVAGVYDGVLKQDVGADRTVTLQLEVKDIPTPVEGGVDPVMTPILTGYLKFVLGSDPNEYIGFGVQKAEFDPKLNKVDLVVNHNDFKDMIFSLARRDSTLSGRWTAPSVGSSGDAVFTKKTAPGTPATSVNTLSGRYQGAVKNTSPSSSLPERAVITLVTSKDPNLPSGVKVSGNLRLYVGEFGSLEFYELPFTEVNYNFLTQKLVAKTGGDYRLTLKAEVNGVSVTGILFADGVGEVADIEVKKL